MHHTKIWGGHGPLAPPFPTPMIMNLTTGIQDCRGRWISRSFLNKDLCQDYTSVPLHWASV